MSTTIVSSNMNLPIPVVGVDAGPDYALNIDACLATIDSHNHSNGQGVQINPNGLNINADLSIGSNNLTLIRSARFAAQSSAISSPSDLGCLYEAGVDLYYNDGNGNQIRITQSGSVTGSSGTITGLPSGTASASYSAGVFRFQSATNTAANLDAGSVVYRNSGASSNGLTLQAPTLATNFSLTLPQVPLQTNLMTLDSSGNMGSVTWNAALANATTGSTFYTPSITPAAGSSSGASSTGQYLQVGKLVFVNLQAVWTQTVAPTVSCTFGLPLPVQYAAVQLVSVTANGQQIYAGCDFGVGFGNSFMRVFVGSGSPQVICPGASTVATFAVGTTNSIAASFCFVTT